jgi:hypothetical protein
VASPASATLTANGTSTETITISSTTAQSSLAPFGYKPGVFLAGLLCCLLSLRRRRGFRALAAFALLALGLATVSGCSSSSSNNSGGGTKKSSAGSYTVTVSAAGTGVSATTTFQLTIN